MSPNDQTGGLAPWCVNEKWEYGVLPDGRRYAKVSGRQTAPKNLTSNPVWWAQNSFEQQVAPWYQPTWPQWRRELYWNYFRNPLQNARLFVWGWADQNYTVTVDEGNPDPMVIQRDDVALPNGQQDLGYQKSTLTHENGVSTRKFTSYCDKKIVWYSGTQPSGLWGFKFNIRSGGGYNPQPA